MPVANMYSQPGQQNFTVEQLRAREARKPVANSIQKRPVVPVVERDVVGPEQIFFEGPPFLQGEAVIENVQVGLGVQSK